MMIVLGIVCLMVATVMVLIAAPIAINAPTLAQALTALLVLLFGASGLAMLGVHLIGWMS